MAYNYRTRYYLAPKTEGNKAINQLHFAEPELQWPLQSSQKSKLEVLQNIS